MASCILWRRCPPCGRWSCCWDEIGKNPGLADTSPKATMRQTRIRFDEAIGMRCGLTGWSVDPFCKILFEFCRKTGSSTCGDIAFYLFFSHAPHLPLSLSLSFLLSRPIFLSLLSFAHTGSLSLTVKLFLRNRSYDSNGQIPLQKDRSFSEETLWGHFTIKQPSLLWFYKVYVQVN